MKNKQKIFVGGQAVIEGVMMRGPKVMATAVREPNGTIIIDEDYTQSLGEKYPILKKPMLRGAIALYESLAIGMKSLAFSAKIAGKEEDEMSDRDIAITMLISCVGAVVLFLILPTYAAKLIPGVSQSPLMLNTIEGIVRLLLFLAYIWGISRTPDIKRVFEYHGAEHKTIHTYELELPLTVENVKKQSRIHPRCGTNFLMIVILISMIIFMFLGWPSLWERIVSRIVLLPVIAGLAYEVIRWAGRSKGIVVRTLVAPGLWLQHLTTREPSDDQIEVAIAALEKVRPDEADAYEE